MASLQLDPDLTRVLSLCTNQDKPTRTRPDPVTLGRAQFLPEQDRQLLQLALAGESYRKIAALIGSNSGSVHRRITRIRRRLENPIAVALIEHGHRLPQQYRALGIAHFLHGLKMPQLIHHSGLTEYEIRNILCLLLGWSKMRFESSLNQ